jgi:hypothetical protein
MKRYYTLILLALFVSGCGLVYGNKILEIEKDYKNVNVFEFELNESAIEHRINVQFTYLEKRSSHSNRFNATLTDPSGETQLKEFTIDRSPDPVDVTHKEMTLFEIFPKAGNYTLKVNGEDGLSFKGKEIKLRVIRKKID